MVNSNIVVAVIAAVGGIVSSYLAYGYGKRRVHRHKGDSTAFAIEGYEKLLRDQQKEISRKSDIIDKLERQVDDMEGIIQTLKTQVAESTNQNFKLQQELESFKTDYNANKL